MEVEPDAPLPAATDPAPEREVWSPVATVLFSVLVVVVHVGVAVVVSIAFAVAMVARDPEADLALLAADLETNGLVLSLATLASTLVVVPLILLLAYLRRGWPVGRYLAFAPVPAKKWAQWILVAVAGVVAMDATSLLLGRPIVPEVQREMFATAGSLPLLWLALVVGAPLVEEFLFRGFLFEGLRRSRLGVAGTIVLTSAIWAGIHLQYGPYEIGWIALLGILLGLARWSTGSIYTPLVMHALWNLISTVETTLL